MYDVGRLDCVRWQLGAKYKLDEPVWPYAIPPDIK